MATRRGAEAPEVTDEFADVEFDDVQIVEDITPVVLVPVIEDLGVEEVPVPPAVPTPDQLATTQSFFGGVPANAGIEDLGVQTVEPDAETFQVAVTEDIGPVFYGASIIEMKKGHLYNVQTPVYEYLWSRGKLVGQ